MDQDREAERATNTGTDLDLDMVVLYQSLFLTEHSIMRANAVESVMIPDSIPLSAQTSDNLERRRVSYIVPTRGLYIPSASRAMDPLVLVYAIALGYLWNTCGFEYIYGVESKCGERAAGKSSIELDRLFEAFINIIDDMVDNGYLIPLPYTAISEDTVSPAVDAGICISPHYSTRKSTSLGTPSLYELYKFISLAEYEYIKAVFTTKLASTLAAQFDKLWDKLVSTARIVNEKYRSHVGYNPDESYCVYFKTLHGEMGRLVENARSLPNVITVSSVNVLPVLIDPPTLPPQEYGIAVGELRKLISEFYMRNKVDRETAEKVSNIIVQSLIKEGIEFLTPYQYETFKNYLISKTGSRDKLVLVLTSPTGTGKTLIFAVIALTLVILWKLQARSGLKVVVVYPRRSLERQQLERLLRLVNHINEDPTFKQVLGDNPIGILIRDRESLGKKDKDKGRTKIRDISLSEKPLEHEVLLEAPDVCLYRSEPKYVYDVKENCYLYEEYIKNNRRVRALENADIIITNHSMLFKIAVHSLSKTWYRDLLEHTGLLVLDEAHVFFDQSYTHIIQSISLIYAIFNPNLDVVFSSATISEEHLVPDGLLTNNVIGIVRKGMAKTEVIENRVKSVLPLISWNSKIIVIDYFKTTYEMLFDSLKSRYRGPMKITVWYVANPYPFKRASTSLEEITVSMAHLVNGIRKRSTELSSLTSIIYVDYKSTLKDIIGYFTTVIIKNAVDHADRVLLSKYGRDALQNILGGNYNVRKEGIELIYRVIENKLKRSKNVLRIIWDLDWWPDAYFSKFHVLTPYIDRKSALALSSINPNTPTQLEEALKNVVGSDIIEHLIFESDIMRQKVAWESDANMSDFASTIAQTICNYTSGSLPYFIVHHGDFHESRKQLDSLLMSTDCSKPLFVMATSTLELGIDIPSVLAIIQYGVTVSPSSLVQRVGRSGRERSTRFISAGVLVLRNDGRDNFFVDDYHVVRYIYNSEPLVIKRIIDDSITLVRLASTIQHVIKDNEKMRKDQDLGYVFLEKLGNIAQSLNSTIEDSSLKEDIERFNQALLKARKIYSHKWKLIRGN